jgi:Mn2+/Fe2+ NRAMP family transporter
VALFIVVTTAATLNATGHTDINTSAEAAQALKPIAGEFAYLIFALGIIGTGLLALPVLAGSAAYALGESLGWKVGLDHKPKRAIGFYTTIAAATGVGLILNATPIDPIKALFWSAVINGVVAVPVMAMLMLMAGDSKIMGRYVIGQGLKTLGWSATAIMALVAIGMFLT